MRSDFSNVASQLLRLSSVDLFEMVHCPKIMLWAFTHVGR